MKQVGGSLGKARSRQPLGFRSFVTSRQFQLQTMIVPWVVLLFIFSYIPMVFLVISFQDYNIIKGIIDSPWVGLKHFKYFLLDPNIFLALRNTLGMNVIGFVVGFPAPIVFALLLNEVRNMRYKKTIQTISYLPHFMSWAIYGGMVITFLNPDGGLLNFILTNLGIIKNPILFISKPEFFWGIYILAGLIKEVGFGSILYIAAIAGINQELYDAGIVDGAGRFARIRYITLPSIAPTMTIMMIFGISYIMGSNFDTIYILQNALNFSASEVLATFTYRIGIGDMRYSYASAVGMTQSLVSVTLLFIANFVSRKISENSLF